MTRRIEVLNRTPWRTADLLRFARRAADEALEPFTKPRLVVVFKTTHGSSVHGRAFIGGTQVTMRLPTPEWAPQDMGLALAFVLTHEFGHSRGLRHAQMRGPAWRWPRTDEGMAAFTAHHGWGLALPLRAKAVRAPKAKPTGAALVEQKMERLRARERAWTTKAKRAETALKTVRRALRYYERRLAAARSEGGA